MQPLSKVASFIVERMQPDRVYGPQELRALVPDTSIEHLREIMHELWIHRRVERAGYSEWRRVLPASSDPSDRASGEVQAVKPEELFDHDAFEPFFK